MFVPVEFWLRVAPAGIDMIRHFSSDLQVSVAW